MLSVVAIIIGEGNRVCPERDGPVAIEGEAVLQHAAGESYSDRYVHQGHDRWWGRRNTPERVALERVLSERLDAGVLVQVTVRVEGSAARCTEAARLHSRDGAVGGASVWVVATARLPVTVPRLRLFGKTGAPAIAVVMLDPDRTASLLNGNARSWCADHATAPPEGHLGSRVCRHRGAGAAGGR